MGTPGRICRFHLSAGRSSPAPSWTATSHWDCTQKTTALGWGETSAGVATFQDICPSTHLRCLIYGNITQMYSWVWEEKKHCTLKGSTERRTNYYFLGGLAAPWGRCCCRFSRLETMKSNSKILQHSGMNLPIWIKNNDWKHFQCRRRRRSLYHIGDWSVSFWINSPSTNECNI